MSLKRNACYPNGSIISIHVEFFSTLRSPPPSQDQLQDDEVHHASDDELDGGCVDFGAVEAWVAVGSPLLSRGAVYPECSVFLSEHLFLAGLYEMAK